MEYFWKIKKGNRGLSDTKHPDNIPNDNFLPVKMKITKPPKKIEKTVEDIKKIKTEEITDFSQIKFGK